MTNILNTMDIKQVFSLHVDYFLFNLAPDFKKASPEIEI